MKPPMKASLGKMMAMPKEMNSSSTTVHAHGNGTFHSDSGFGQRMEHPSFGHLVAHLASKHATGNQVHVEQQDGGKGMTMHGMKKGKVSGPHSAANMAMLQKSMGKFLDEESKEA